MKVVYQWWSALVFAAIIVQVGLAGYGAFYVVGKTDNGGVANDNTVSSGFDPHVAWGYLGIGLGTLILLILGVIAGIGKWRLGKHGILFLLFILQVVLAGGGYSTPYLGFLHPVNALVMFTLSGSIAYSTWREARLAKEQGTAAAPAAQEPAPVEQEAPPIAEQPAEM